MSQAEIDKLRQALLFYTNPNVAGQPGVARKALGIVDPPVVEKCIPITTCKHCPHHDHKGGFGVVQYIPICRFNGQGKELPYKALKVYAQPTGVIPDWCPLPNRKEEK